MVMGITKLVAWASSSLERWPEKHCAALLVGRPATQIKECFLHGNESDVALVVGGQQHPIRVSTMESMKTHLILLLLA